MCTVCNRRSASRTPMSTASRAQRRALSTRLPLTNSMVTCPLPATPLHPIASATTPHVLSNCLLKQSSPALPPLKPCRHRRQVTDAHQPPRRRQILHPHLTSHYTLSHCSTKRECGGQTVAHGKQRRRATSSLTTLNASSKWTKCS